MVITPVFEFACSYRSSRLILRQEENCDGDSWQVELSQSGESERLGANGLGIIVSRLREYLMHAGPTHGGDTGVMTLAEPYCFAYGRWGGNGVVLQINNGQAQLIGGIVMTESERHQWIVDLSRILGWVLFASSETMPCTVCASRVECMGGNSRPSICQRAMSENPFIGGYWLEHCLDFVGPDGLPLSSMGSDPLEITRIVMDRQPS